MSLYPKPLFDRNDLETIRATLRDTDPHRRVRRKIDDALHFFRRQDSWLLEEWLLEGSLVDSGSARNLAPVGLLEPTNDFERRLFEAVSEKSLSEARRKIGALFSQCEDELAREAFTTHPMAQAWFKENEDRLIAFAMMNP